MISLKNGDNNIINNSNDNSPVISSNIITGNLNYMPENDYIFESLSLTGVGIFNITCSSTKSADLFFYFTSNIDRLTYFDNKHSSVWSDEFLITYGKPLWGANWSRFLLEIKNHFYSQ